MFDDRYFSTFVGSYVDTALWSSDDEDGVPLDYNYTPDEVAGEARRIILDECRDFIQLASNELEESGLTPGDAGHNFWLTRNGHGAGFWDLGLGEVGLALTRKAKTFGEADLYVSRGKIYQA